MINQRSSIFVLLKFLKFFNITCLRSFNESIMPMQSDKISLITLILIYFENACLSTSETVTISTRLFRH